MYQFYYAVDQEYERGKLQDDVVRHFQISAVRPAMWEEHCLECSAPLCYRTCLYYAPRNDGRCRRFENGLQTFWDDRACCGQGAHVKFRKWANMMTIIFPSVLSVSDYQALSDVNQKLGMMLKKIAESRLPVIARWETIRILEYLRRRKLRRMPPKDGTVEAFVFHGYSYNEENYNLIMEIYNDYVPVYRTSIPIARGENLYILNREQLSDACWRTGYLVKIYPENNLEAELDILWCDFVQGKTVLSEKPAANVKCVVWDLDNTLWDGTLIETEDDRTLKLRENVMGMIQQLDERGILQSIASKNDYEAAWPVIERLGLADYFLYPQINWDAKSRSMETIARNLNIGIDSLVLIDDAAFEREQVKNKWPQVRAYDAIKLVDLLNRPEFQVVVTDESRHRRAMYLAEEKRSKLKIGESGDTIDFLRKCHLCARLFEPVTTAEKLRCYELMVRTNQLNMSGKKYEREDFDRVLQKPGHTNFAFSCRDDFGEYGIVGFGQYRTEGQSLVFSEFAMSCRVAGKYVESAVFKALLEREGCTGGIFPVTKTKKNILLRRTLEEIGFAPRTQSSDRVEYGYDSQLLHSNIVSVKQD